MVLYYATASQLDMTSSNGQDREPLKMLVGQSNSLYALQTTVGHQAYPKVQSSSSESLPLTRMVMIMTRIQDTYKNTLEA